MFPISESEVLSSPYYMSLHFFETSPVARLLPGQPRTRRLLLYGLFAVAFLLGLGYHVMLWRSGEPAGLGLVLLYHLVLVLGYGALWQALAEHYKRQRHGPGRIFWTAALFVPLFLIPARLLASLGTYTVPDDVAASALGFDYTTGVPLAWATVLKMNVIALLEIAFAFVLLLRLRELVFFKRTRPSQRNWFLMLGLMVGASLLTVGSVPGSDLTDWQILLVIPAVALMVVNSFRLSWIAFLSFREKLAGIGLSLLLLTLLSIGMSTGLESNAYSFLAHYSHAASLFVKLTMSFGILYCTTALLSLLFHLPTTSDFQQKASEIAAMHSLTNLVGQVFDAERLTASITASPVEANLAQAAWLAVADPQSGSLQPRIVSTYGVSAARVHELIDLDALYDDLTARRELLLLDEAPTDHRVNARPGGRLGSMAALPLTARGKLLGALFVTKEMAHGFEKDDLEALSVFGAQAALALDNARLFEEQLENERLARELDIAREVQQRLLPQCLPDLPGLSICASSVPALEVGGDYYDFVRLDDDRLAVIVGDVSGKGSSAAFYMAEMQGIFRALSGIISSPHAFLTQANRALADTLEKHVFISVIYGVVDLQAETFTLARAGHCPAAIINLDGEPRLLRSRGLGLGLNRNALFSETLVEETIRMQPGDVFVLYTDGVVESRNAHDEEYGYDRLLRSLREHRHEDVAVLHDNLLDDLHAFLGHEEYDDDMTLTVLKWHGVDLPELADSRMQPPRRATVEEETDRASAALPLSEKVRHE